MKKRKLQLMLIAVFVASVSLLHFVLGTSQHHYLLFLRELYFLPIILASFWFGLRGGMVTSLCITAYYLPHTLMTWQGFSPDDFGKLMELFLYNLAAFIMGTLKDRESAEQRRVLEAENLASMGRALAAVAHDMKTPLIAIGGYTMIVQKKLEQGDPNREKLNVVIAETERLEGMVKEMLDFSRPLTIEKSVGNLNRLVTESVEIVKASMRGRNVTIVTKLAEKLSPAEFDAQRMKQVLVNLLLNAVDASPDGETVTVITSGDEAFLLIEVADNGFGIPSEQDDDIFVPFFTTKKSGTGLGLSIVKKIVEAHTGLIEVVNRAEKGVTFKIFLPVKGR